MQTHRLNTSCILLVAVTFVTSEYGLACEDQHPPAITTPSERFIFPHVNGGHVLTIAFDPRGVGAVMPQGDDGNRWLNSADPDGAWHYREWQWWKGHPWGDSCRPRYYAEPKFETPKSTPRRVVITYQIDGFDCRQTFLLPDAFDPAGPYWDLVTTIRNTSGIDVEEYGHFFACYTPLNRSRSFWYWDESSQLLRFADRGVKHLDGYIAHPQAYFVQNGAIPHCPRGGGKLIGRWGKPMLVSHASPAGWRSIIMIESQYAAALAQGIEGVAMDYILFPGPDKRVFTKGAQFSAHIRHVMLKSPDLPTTKQLQTLWDSFTTSHVSTHELANQP